MLNQAWGGLFGLLAKPLSLLGKSGLKRFNRSAQRGFLGSFLGKRKTSPNERGRQLRRPLLVPNTLTAIAFERSNDRLPVWEVHDSDQL